jgi:hypothetical protein
MENKTNDIKDQFIQDYYDGKKSTLTQYLSSHSDDIDTEEFLDWGLAFAMLHAQETYIRNMTVKKLREKLSDLDWCDNFEITVLVNNISKRYSIDSVSDFSLQIEYPDGTKSPVSHGVDIVIHMDDF